MRRKLWGALAVALVCGAALAGCGSKAGGAEVLAEVDAFTEELVGKVEGAADPSAGVGEAQKLLDARREGLRAKVSAWRRSEEFRRGGELRRRWDERESDNAFRVAGLRTKYIDRAMSDAEFKTRLDALVADYQKLFEP
ncbi:MAG TPA: hypothetical protein VGV38_11070 [Pyrinomonadaceae bacterium]|nr:hypothetical protein [Pyrinomonadaceae bacterium]